MARYKIDKQRLNMAVEATKAGNYAVVVAAYIGISEQTYYNYMNKGEELANEMYELQGKLEAAEEAENHLEIGRIMERCEAIEGDIRLEFFESIRKAEAEAEIGHVEIITNASKKTWQAAAWMLERKYKDRWARVHKVESVDSDDNELADIVAGRMAKRKAMTDE